MREKKNKRRNFHLVTIAALSFVLCAMIGELVVYIVQELTRGSGYDEYVLPLYIIPVFSVLITCGLIYLVHMVLSTSNRLMDGLYKISEGDYEVTIPYKRLDMFNGVYENFNKMVKELKSVRTQREDFVHDFSHEFKTPIASINGFANLLLDGDLSEEERKEIIKIIADESARLSRLAESTLAMSKIENQQFVGEKKEFRLDTQIKECIILLERSWDEKKINLSSELEETTYFGDDELLSRVWINLLTNAVKFTPEGGEISVSLKKEDGGAVVRIKDNGIGIPEEEREKIFEKFYRASAKVEGNGLGLAICKRILEICGGSVSVESEVGKGSTFTVRLK